MSQSPEKDPCRCPIHPTEQLTNLCCNKSCLTALCPECIDDHNKKHKLDTVFPEIDTIKRVKTMCVKQIQNAVNVLQEELSRVKKFSSMSADDILAEAERDLSAARKAMHRSIDDFYDAILEDYASKIKQNITKTYDFKDLEEELRQLVVELRSLEDQFKGRDLISAIRKTTSLDMNEIVITYQERTQAQMEKRLSLPIDVDFSEKDKRDFLNDLGKYIRLRNKDIGINLPEGERNRVQQNILKLATDETSSYFTKKFKASQHS